MFRIFPLSIIRRLCCPWPELRPLLWSKRLIIAGRWSHLPRVHIRARPVNLNLMHDGRAGPMIHGSRAIKLLTRYVLRRRRDSTVIRSESAVGVSNSAEVRIARDEFRVVFRTPWPIGVSSPNLGTPSSVLQQLEC